MNKKETVEYTKEELTKKINKYQTIIQKLTDDLKKKEIEESRIGFKWY